MSATPNSSEDEDKVEKIRLSREGKPEGTVPLDGDM